MCVLGAGIIGSSTAFRILDRFPDVEMDVIADVFSPNTTSDVAAGIWEPHVCPLTKIPDEYIRWEWREYKERKKERERGERKRKKEKDVKKVCLSDFDSPIC
jgi:glycine/D-amino acid oxidase-like deaminating enzyme